MTKLTHSCNCKITAERFDWMRRFGGRGPYENGRGTGGGVKGAFFNEMFVFF